MTRHYRAYGLRFASDVALPFREDQPGAPDVEVFDDPELPDDSFDFRFRNWEAEPGKFRIHVAGAGTALILDGRQIRYRRDRGAETAELVSLIIGSGLAAILMQRDIVPLHSCAVEVDGRALLVVGQSGAGKSTLLGGLLQHGLTMLADDVTGLALTHDGDAIAIPGFPATRLWRDSLKLLGRSEDGLPRVRSDTAKFYLEVPSFSSAPLPLHGIAWLSPGNGNELAFERLDGAQGFHTLSKFVFRKRFLAGLGKQAMGFRTVASGAAGARMVRMVRPAGAIPPRDMAARLLDEFA